MIKGQQQRVIIKLWLQKAVKALELRQIFSSCLLSSSQLICFFCLWPQPNGMRTNFDNSPMTFDDDEDDDSTTTRWSSERRQTKTKQTGTDNFSADFDARHTHSKQPEVQFDACAMRKEKQIALTRALFSSEKKTRSNWWCWNDLKLGQRWR